MTPLPLPAALILLFGSATLPAQDDVRKATPPFRWFNEVPPDLQADPALIHGKFHSPANQAEVGYFVALPRGYDAPEARDRRFPVIYYLHGGLQGSEGRAIQGYPRMAAMLTSAAYPAAFLVMVNGGRPNYLDTAGSKGESALLELIAHLDRTHRTIATPAGRALIGHSMGGRATGRLLFKHPELFGSGVAISGGHQREKAMAEGAPDTGPDAGALDPRNNSFDNATRYAAQGDAPKVRLFVLVGNQDANYAPNLEWCVHLARLKIPHELMIAPDAGHGIDLQRHDPGRRVFAFIAHGFRAIPDDSPARPRP